MANNDTKIITESGKQELFIEREFDAPRDLVWKVWTDPDMFVQWWGPKDFTAPVARMDLRVGGEYFSCMRSPDGQDFCSKGVYREIVPSKRLVMTDSFADKEGNKVSATHYGLGEDFPMQMLIKVTLEEEGDKTKFTLEHSDVKNLSDTELKDMTQGWNETLDKLAEYLAKV
ncbi:MAG: SRPBCC family protein [Methanobacterium sp.]